MPTYSPKASEITRAWHVIDADGLVLGRMCTEAARVLRGKHKPIFAPHIDTGDHVVVINASKVVLTKDKAANKGVYRYSEPGGDEDRSYESCWAQAGKPPTQNPGNVAEGRSGANVQSSRSTRTRIPRGPAPFVLNSRGKARERERTVHGKQTAHRHRSPQGSSARARCARTTARTRSTRQGVPTRTHHSHAADEVTRRCASRTSPLRNRRRFTAADSGPSRCAGAGDRAASGELAPEARLAPKAGCSPRSRPRKARSTGPQEARKAPQYTKR